MASKHSVVNSQMPFTLEIMDKNGPGDNCLSGFFPKTYPKLLNLLPLVGESQTATMAHAQDVEAPAEGYEGLSSSESSPTGSCGPVESMSNPSSGVSVLPEDVHVAPAEKCSALAIANLSNKSSYLTHNGDTNEESYMPVNQTPPTTNHARIHGRAAVRHGPSARSSKFIGVTHYKRTGRWEAHIWREKKQMYLGASYTENQAARAYDRAAIHFRRTEAVLNFNLADYFEELQQLAQISSEDLVTMLRKQSAGRGKPEPEYPRALRQLRQQRVATTEAGTLEQEIPLAGVLLKSNSQVVPAAHELSLPAVSEPQVDTSQGQNDPLIQHTTFQTNSRADVHDFSHGKEGDRHRPLCPSVTVTSIPGGAEHISALTKCTPKGPSFSKGSVDTEGSAQGCSHCSGMLGWGLSLGFTHVESSVCQHMNPVREKMHSTISTTALTMSSTGMNTSTIYSPQTATVLKRKRKYLQMINGLLNHKV